MNDGMSQLVFVAIIVILSLLEGVARKRRTQDQPTEPEDGGPRPEDRESVAPPPRAPEAVRERLAAAYRPRQERTRASAEAMLPAELWEEIQKIARSPGQGQPARTRRRATPPAFEPAAPPSTPAAPTLTPSAPAAAAPRAQAPDAYAVSVERSPEPGARGSAGTEAAERGPAVDAAGLRAALRHRASLRRAVVWQEILGPPMALLRPDRVGDE